MSFKENIHLDDQSVVINDQNREEGEDGYQNDNTLKSTDIQFPFTKINSNTYQQNRIESTINARQTMKKATRVEEEQPAAKGDHKPASVSSADEFYETSPILDNDEEEVVDEEEIYFPTLLDETNYPVVHVPIQPHMSRPLNKFGDLNLKNIPIAQTPKSFPLDSQEAKDQDEIALYNIMEYEFENNGDDAKKNSWWSPNDCWSKFVHNEEDVEVKESLMGDANLDLIFNNIYST